jgi:hypothetical protein
MAVQKEMRMKTGVLCAVVVSILLVGKAKAMDANDVRSGFLGRIHQLRNLDVVYDVKEVATRNTAAEIMNELKGMGVSTDGDFSVVEGSTRLERFSCLDGKARYESGEQLMMASPLADGTLQHEKTDIQSRVRVVTGDRIENLSLCPWARPEGRITSGPDYDEDTIDKLWGLRLPGMEIGNDSVPDWCEVKALGDGMGELRTTYDEHTFERWVFDVGKGYAPVLQERFAKDRGIVVRTHMSKWKQVGGVWLAYQIEIDSICREPNGIERVYSTATYTVKSCDLNSKKNTPALYRMVWPEGTVIDNVLEGKRYVVKDGKLEPVANDRIRRHPPQQEGAM